jgi:Flp pilus assembly protein TadB
MENLIIHWGVILIWIVLDPLIEPKLSKLTNASIQNYFWILEQENPSLWQKRRYNQSHRLRLIWLVILVWQNTIQTDVLFIALIITAYLLPWFRIRSSVKRQSDLIRYQFPIYLRQLQILMQNNTVVRAIELSIPQAPPYLRTELSALHLRLLSEPQKLTSYTSFMDHVDQNEIERAMKWLYRFENTGQKDAGRQFNRMIASTSKWLRQERQYAKQKRLMLSQWLGMVPLIGVTLVFLSAMMSVLMTMFERR